MKRVEVKFDKEAFDEYKKLENLVSIKAKRNYPSYSQLFESINKKLEILRKNPFYGDLIPRRNIPKDTSKFFGTEKIFRIELVGFWRLLYTLVGDEAKIIAFILEFSDHKRYDRLFRYKRK